MDSEKSIAATIRGADLPFRGTSHAQPIAAIRDLSHGP
jgi:hypothetical protein